MSSKEYLSKLFKELCIRFDTDPKRYSKLEYATLLKYLKELTDQISSIEDAKDYMLPIVLEIDLITTNLENKIELNKSDIGSLDTSVEGINTSVTAISNSILNILTKLDTIDDTINPLSIQVTCDYSATEFYSTSNKELVIKVFKGNADVTSNSVIKINNLTCSSTTSVVVSNLNKQFTITATYNNSSATKQINFPVYKKIYHGHINNSVINNILPTSITGLNYTLQKFPISVLLNTTNSLSAILAYPKEYGLLTEISDLNRFICTEDFQYKLTNIGQDQYYVYYRTQVGPLNQPFNFKI